MQNHHEPGSREHHPHLGAPPPLISPKPPQPPREHHPPPPTTLWNPISLIETASESRRSHEPSGMGHFELSRGPQGPSKYEDGTRRRDMAVIEKYPPHRTPLVLSEHGTFLADLEKSTQSLLSQQRASMSLPSQYEMEGSLKIHAGLKNLQGHPVHSRHGQGLGMMAGAGIGPLTAQGPGPDTVLIYDEFLQQHRRPVSKLDLEEKRRREAREKGIHHRNKIRWTLLGSRRDWDKMSHFSYLGTLHQGNLSLIANLLILCIPSCYQNECTDGRFD